MSLPLRPPMSFAVLRARSAGRRLRSMAHLARQSIASRWLMRVGAPQAMISSKSCREGHAMKAGRDRDRRSKTIGHPLPWLAGVVLSFALCLPAAAQMTDLQLALMVDASGS